MNYPLPEVAGVVDSFEEELLYGSLYAQDDKLWLAAGTTAAEVSIKCPFAIQFTMVCNTF